MPGLHIISVPRWRQHGGNISDRKSSLRECNTKHRRVYIGLRVAAACSLQAHRAAMPCPQGMEGSKDSDRKSHHFSPCAARQANPYIAQLRVHVSISDAAIAKVGR